MTTHDPEQAFRLWNAFSADAGVLSFDVTRVNMPRIARPDSEWLTAACQAVGAPGATAAGRVTPMRSSYFSDYSEEDAVEDRWADCWVVEATLADDQVVNAECGVVPVTLGALDPSWTGERDPGHDACALIMGVGEPGAAPTNREDAIGVARRAGLEPASADLIVCADGRPAVRVVTPCEFSADAGALEAVTDELRDSGWATNWRAALRPPSRPPTATDRRSCRRR